MQENETDWHALAAELLTAADQLHDALDITMALLITCDKTFRPTTAENGTIWKKITDAALVRSKAAAALK